MAETSGYQKLKNGLKPLVPKPLFKAGINTFHMFEAIVANIRYGFPAKSMKFIGVTGTNGKTSTTVMIAGILEAAGFVVGMNSTAIIKDGKKTFENNLDGGLTNAGPFTMQKLLKRMKQNGVQWVVMESASQALDQHRLWGVTFETAAITNLTNEHLDYHGTMENYARAKARLFKKTRGAGVINIDDEWGEYFYKLPGRKVRYGKNAPEYKLKSVQHKSKLTTVTFENEGKDYEINLKVQGEFNAYNALAALAATHEVGVDIATAIKGLESIERIPGRMDAVEAGQDFRVLIDYAHTPDAIKNVLKAARLMTTNHLICVTGAAGERPISRRAPVGKIANELSDILIVTDDEPFSEDPDKIRNELLSGVKKGAHTAELIVVEDRCEAMAKAFEVAEKGDTIVIAGMGHQKYRSGPRGKEPWDDFAVAKDILNGKKNKVCINWHQVFPRKVNH